MSKTNPTRYYYAMGGMRVTNHSHLVELLATPIATKRHRIFTIKGMIVMGQAASNIATETAADLAIARKRTGKPLRGVGHYTGNLSAFTRTQHGRKVMTSATPRPGKQREVRSAHDTPTATENPTAIPAPPDTHAINTNDAHRENHPAAAGNDLIGAGIEGASPIARRSKTAAAVLLALATGSVVGSLWTFHELREQAQVSANADLQSFVMRPTSDEVQEPENKLLPESLPMVSGMDPIVEQLDATRKLADSYLEEIEWLHAQNADLLEQVDVLDNETIELNRELLQLELALAALESESQPMVETRTVYNFVNVPIGSGVDPMNNPSVPEAGYDESDDDYAPYADDGYADDGYVDDAYTEDAYTEEELFIENDVDHYAIDEQLLYDPDTGYYMNPQFHVTDEELINGRDTEVFYPPIAQDEAFREVN